MVLGEAPSGNSKTDPSADQATPTMPQRRFPKPVAPERRFPIGDLSIPGRRPARRIPLGVPCGSGGGVEPRFLRFGEDFFERRAIKRSGYRPIDRRRVRRERQFPACGERYISIFPFLSLPFQRRMIVEDSSKARRRNKPLSGNELGDKLSGVT